jgi:hypothetical protein
MRRFSVLKIAIIGIVVGILILGVVYFGKNDRTFDGTDRILQRVEKAQVDTTAKQMIDRTQETKLIKTTLEVPGLSYQVFVPEGSSVFDLMTAATKQFNNFSFRGREFPGLGFFVEEINGLSQDKKAGMYWIYYINGQKAQVGISQYKLKENDVITWKYEKGY